MDGTGFYRAEKIDNRWWIVDPKGHLCINMAVVEVGPGGSERQEKTLQNNFGSIESWAVQTTKLLKNNGFNGAGNWSDVEILKEVDQPLIYSVYINPMKDFRNWHREKYGPYKNAGWQGFEHDLIMVFDPKFKEFVQAEVEGLEKFKEDKYLLGYFTDNEMPFKSDALDRHLKYLDENDPGYQAAKQWLVERKGEDAGLDDITAEDREAFNGYYAEQYFKIVVPAIKEKDPNHMYLGCRFNQEREELLSPSIFAAAGKYADILSINHYRKWEPDSALLANWESWSGKPFLITEWYVKGADTGMPNTTGAGWIVKTQKDRGLFYQNFTLSLLKSKVCVGWHWFKYQDNDPQDLTTDPSNRDSNKGIVDVFYDPYQDLLDEMSELNNNAYHLIDYFDKNAGTKLLAN